MPIVIPSSKKYKIRANSLYITLNKIIRQLKGSWSEIAGSKGAVVTLKIMSMALNTLAIGLGTPRSRR
jgi:hypothetical protein